MTTIMPRAAALPLNRRSLLLAGTVSALVGCAASETPAELGYARSAWERRRQGTGLKATLLVSVSNVKVGQGSVHVGLYNSDTRFPAQGVDLATTVVAADSATVTARFEAVPLGKYALAAFQDEDGNGRLNTSLGIPTEPYGFSNKASVGFGGPPSFKEASFEVNDKVSTQEIAL